MKTNISTLLSPTAIASFLVLIGSLSMGVGTGYLAFYLGTESLTGVTSPEENPTQKKLIVKPKILGKIKILP